MSLIPIARISLIFATIDFVSNILFLFFGEFTTWLRLLFCFNDFSCFIFGLGLFFNIQNLKRPAIIFTMFAGARVILTFFAGSLYNYSTSYLISYLFFNSILNFFPIIFLLGSILQKKELSDFKIYSIISICFFILSFITLPLMVYLYYGFADLNLEYYATRAYHYGLVELCLNDFELAPTNLIDIISYFIPICYFLHIIIIIFPFSYGKTSEVDFQKIDNNSEIADKKESGYHRAEIICLILLMGIIYGACFIRKDFNLNDFELLRTIKITFFIIIGILIGPILKRSIVSIVLIISSCAFLSWFLIWLILHCLVSIIV